MNDTETLSPVLPDGLEEATRRLLAKACERELVLATAESCTGGMLASLLTDVQGVAHAFDRGFVTYSEEAKTEMLGVPAALIAGEGRGLEGGRGGDGGGRAVAPPRQYRACRSPVSPMPARSRGWSISPARAPGV